MLTWDCDDDESELFEPDDEDDGVCTALLGRDDDSDEVMMSGYQTFET